MDVLSDIAITDALKARSASSRQSNLAQFGRKENFVKSQRWVPSVSIVELTCEAMNAGGFIPQQVEIARKTGRNSFFAVG